jgi:predicted nucleic-acid-binding protein
MEYDLDTNCILRWLFDLESKQGQLVDSLLSSNTKCHISDITVAELVWVLTSHFKLDRDIITTTIQRVLDNKKIISNKTLFESVLPVYRANVQLSFVDVCLAKYAQLSGHAGLLTFDKNLAKKMPKEVRELK